MVPRLPGVHNNALRIPSPATRARPTSGRNTRRAWLPSGVGLFVEVAVGVSVASGRWVGSRVGVAVRSDDGTVADRPGSGRAVEVGRALLVGVMAGFTVGVRVGVRADVTVGMVPGIIPDWSIRTTGAFLHKEENAAA